MVQISRHAISPAFEFANRSRDAQPEVMVDKVIQISKTKVLQSDDFRRSFELNFASLDKMHGECINALKQSIEEVRFSLVLSSLPDVHYIGKRVQRVVEVRRKNGRRYGFMSLVSLLTFRSARLP